MLAIALGTATACDSGDDDADPATTQPVATSPPTGPPGPTAEPSTTSTTTTTTTLPPTTLPPTTTSPEQVKAEVAAAFVALDSESFALLAAPSLDGLDAKAAAIAIPGSPYFQVVVDRVTELVTNEQFAAPNQPDLRSVTVERVELEGAAPYTNALVTVCQVTNAVTMKGPNNSLMPGTTFPVVGTGDVAAYRFTQNLRLTPEGWRHEQIADPSDPYWPGLSACPAP
ncbi:MAG: hypothetical protein ABW195_09850 [Ilumatobacteraceae bacterium]